MDTLTRYLVFEVLKAALLTSLVLLAIYNFVTFTDEFRHVGEGEYGLANIFRYLALTSPRNYYHLMPASALIGSLLALGHLSNNLELTAMRIAGMPVYHIIRASVIAGLLLALFSASIGEFIAPQSERRAQELRATAKHKQISMQTGHGFWLKDRDEFVNIRQIGESDEIKNINIFRFNGSQELIYTAHAKTGTYQLDHWQLQEVNETYLNSNPVISSERASMRWQTILDPELLRVVVVKPDNLSIVNLYTYVNFLQKNKQSAAAFEYSLWNRLLYPFSILVMMLLALPFVLGFTPRFSGGHRVIIGVVIGLSFILAEKLLGKFALVYQIQPIAAALVPLTIFGLATLFGLRKAR